MAAEKAKRFREICDWISPVRPWENHEAARNRHEPGTGGWLLESDSYCSWKSGSISHLWLYGPAGSGKTVLCSTAIEDIRMHCNSERNAGQAIFYFSFADLSRQTYESLVHSIVVQLGWKEPGRSFLDEAYDGQRRVAFGVDKLDRALRVIAPSYDEVILHLDGLDECPPVQDAQHDLMLSLQRLLQDIPRIRMIATSRDRPDIRARMEAMSVMAMPLNTHAVDADIRRHVLAELAEDGKLRQLDSLTKERIEATIVQRANGMFWWACCQLNELKKTRSTKPRAVQAALLTLPSTLDEMYARILTNIHDEDRQDALVLLRWITYAKRPLTAHELSEATIIEPSFAMATEGTVDEENRGSWSDALSILAGLIVVDNMDDNSRNAHVPANAVSGNTIVRLAHFSIKEFLESSRILGSDARMFHLESNREHLFLTDSCISYVNHYSDSPAKCAAPIDFATFPLLEYACRNWYFHSKSSKTDAYTVRISSLLMSDRRRRDMLRCYQPDNNLVSPFVADVDDLGSGLYHASFLVMESTVKEMLYRGADVNAQGGVYGFPLQAAAVAGNRLVVQMLLEKGAEVNACGGFRSNALIAATREGHVEIVKLLLDRGAELTMDRNNMTALHLVGSTENTHIADVILASGVSVDLTITRRLWYPTWTTRGRVTESRQWWSSEEDPEIPKVDSPSKRGLTPLHHAALIGSVAMTKYFINHGADPNAKSNYGETPLHLTVKKSLHGPDYRTDADDWNDPTCRIENALYPFTRGIEDALDHFNLEDDMGYVSTKAKVDRTRNEMIEALLDHENIDLDAKCDQGLGVLHCVPYKEFGSADILSRLLRRNLTIDARNPVGQTALHLACVQGNAKAVSLLIEHGANILASDHSGRNSIHHAAQKMDLATLQTILPAAKQLGQRIIDSRDAKGWNAMHHLLYSLMEGSTWDVELDLIRCLIDNDVPINALNDDGEPPIALYLKWSFASTSEHTTIIDHLFATGADALYRSSNDGSNLAHLAAAYSHELNIELLETFERRGVRLNDEDNHGRTILHHCAQNGSLANAAVAAFLCDHVGLSPVAPNAFGESPLEIAIAEDARRRGHWSIDPDRYQRTAQLLAAHVQVQSGSPSGFQDKPLPFGVWM